MRILHLTDTHLGSYWRVRGAPSQWARWRDHHRALELALEPALHEQVDLVVHSGDVFDGPQPARAALHAAADLLRRVARRVPVVVIPGNHDRLGVRRLLPVDEPGLHLVGAGEARTVGELRLGFVPYKRDARAWAMYAARVCSGGVDALVTHQAFHGVRVPGLRFHVGRQRDTVGEQHVPPGVRWVLCGHIHPRQQVEVGEAVVVHPGSTERTAYSERDEVKGYAIWEFGASVSHQLVDLPSRPLVFVQSEADLQAVAPGSLVRLTEAWRTPVVEADVLHRGGWLVGLPAGVAQRPPQRSSRDQQLRMFP